MTDARTRVARCTRVGRAGRRSTIAAGRRVERNLDSVDLDTDGSVRDSARLLAADQGSQEQHSFSTRGRLAV